MFLGGKIRNVIRDEEYNWERTQKLDGLFEELTEVNNAEAKFGIYR